MEPHQDSSEEIILDIDLTHDPLHGTRKVGSSEVLRLLLLLPLCVFYGRHPLSQAEAGENRRCRQQIRSCCGTRESAASRTRRPSAVGSATHSAVARMLF